MTLESLGEQAKAKEARSAAAARSPSLEARYQYASFLKNIGRSEDAESQIKTMTTGFEFLTRYIRKNQTKWVDAARDL
jgi:hypothetical protein